MSETEKNLDFDVRLYRLASLVARSELPRGDTVPNGPQVVLSLHYEYSSTTL